MEEEPQNGQRELSPGQRANRGAATDASGRQPKDGGLRGKREGEGAPERVRLTMEPMAPLPGVGMKAAMAVRAVRTLQEGCQCSGWWEEMDRQIFVLVWKRPFGVSIMKDGGFIGYSAGRRMRPW